MEFLAQLSWVDALVAVLLAAGAVLGLVHGVLRYLFGSLAVIVAFVVAAQLKRPLTDALGFWAAYTPAIRELLLFIALYLIVLIGLWFAIRGAFGNRAELQRVIDEVGGAIFGILFAALAIVFFLVILDSFYATPAGIQSDEESPLLGLYNTLNGSILIRSLRDALIPTAGLLAQPFVPSDVRAVLQR